MTDPDYAALAAQAAKDHQSANERYWKAGADSNDAAFREVIFTAASHGVATLVLEASDQGDWMYVTQCLDGKGAEIDEDIDEELSAVSDMPDHYEAEWAKVPGVTAEFPRSGATARIDVQVAAEALLFEEEIREGAENMGAPYDDEN